MTKLDQIEKQLRLNAKNEVNKIYTASSTSTEYQAFMIKLRYSESLRLARLRYINGDYDN